MAMPDSAADTALFADDVQASTPHAVTGYRAFKLGAFELSRDEYFARITWPAKGDTRSHLIPVDAFLRAMMRDVAWGFFYGWVNFDHVIGTRNYYGKVDLYAGSFNGTLKAAGVNYTENFETPLIMATFKAILRDWTNATFDPFAAPQETGSAFGRKNGDNIEAIERARIVTLRMPGLPGDSPLRNDLPVNRQFADVSQDEPEIHAAEGFEGQLHAFSLLLARKLYGLSPGRFGPGFWLNTLITMIILLGQSVQDSAAGKDVYTAFAVRMSLFIAVTLYACLMVYLLDQRQKTGLTT